MHVPPPLASPLPFGVSARRKSLATADLARLARVSSVRPREKVHAKNCDKIGGGAGEDEAHHGVVSQAAAVTPQRLKQKEDGGP